MSMTRQEYEAKYVYRIADKKRTKQRAQCRRFKQAVQKREKRGK